MMRWRVIVALVALVAAVAGALGVLRYARGADERAVAEQRTSAVLIVTQTVLAGTPVEELPVRTALLPAIAVPANAIATLDGLAGRVASVDLVAGEVLLESRLVAGEEFGVRTPIEVPLGTQLFTFPVGTERALGGRLAPGDRIAVYASFSDSPLTPATTAPADDDEDVAVTTGTRGGSVAKLLIPSLLIIDVQATDPIPAVDAEGTSSLAPEGALLLTVAADVATIERLMFVLEFGAFRVARLEDGSSLEGSRLRTPVNVYG